MGLLSGLMMLTVVVVALGGADKAAGDLTHRLEPAQADLEDASRATAEAQGSFLAAIQTADPQARVAAINSAQGAGRVQTKAWTAYLRHSSDEPDERALQQSFDASSRRSVELGAMILSVERTNPAFAAALADERRESDNQVRVLAALDSRYASMLKRSGATAANGIRDARIAAIGSYAALTVLFSIVGVVLMKGARRDQRLMANEASALRTAGRQAEFERSLQSGLDMESTEDAALDVVRQALSMVVADVPAELLLADSSHAHFRQVFSTDSSADAACRVGSPTQCPAAASGQTHSFDDSTHLDTCPFLRGRDSPVWAVCVPVSIAGRTTGVIHAQQPIDQPPPARIAGEMEVVARKAGDRIGALRVLSRTEAQAQTDPLTGLPNRRTLESEVHQLVGLDTPFVVAFADLDHFKSLNDMHGHETGDRALRLFARVLRDSIRPRDLLARYGGEEFIVVLPECSVDEARAVAERIRSHLAVAVKSATVPAFTVTIGLAAAGPGDAFSEVVAGADEAMLHAKSEGRDRVLVVGEIGATSHVAPLRASG